jgi:lipopolysaccharide/colanic/teichoic acid biosynthesis glycosyltransferase
MRGVPRLPLSRHARQRDAPDQLRHLADWAIAFILLALTLPLMIIVALMIRSESPDHPVFQRHNCIGLGGRRFEMLKFRTIAHDPENITPSCAQKPTAVGQFLRRTRIDALPQLINVLRGEMSIVDRDAGSPSFLD